MARNVKTIPEKNVDVEKIIGKLLDTSGLKIDEFLFKTSISMDAYRKMKDRQAFSDKAVENILAKLDVNKGFLKGEEDLTLSGKLTGVQTGSDNKENPLEDREGVYRTIVEGHTEYYLIPKTVFQEKYILVALDQFNKEKEKWEQDKQSFNKLLDMFEKELDKRESASKAQGTENTKQGP